MNIIKSGNQYSLSFKFTNKKTGTIAKNVIAAVVLDGNLTLDSITSPSGGVQGSNPDEYLFGDIFANQEYIVNVTVTVVNESATLPITLTLTTSSSDSNLNNNTITKDLVQELSGVLCSDLAQCAVSAPTNLSESRSIGNYIIENSNGDGVTMSFANEVLPGIMSPLHVNEISLATLKLTGIEDNATADQTGAEIKALYEAEANTNAFTDSLKSKLDSLESSKFLGTYVNLSALQIAHPSPVVGSYAHVDAGVANQIEYYVWDNDDNAYQLLESASTAETPASIKVKYESNANTNEYSDSEKNAVSNLPVNTIQELSNKANLNHTHTKSEITDFNENDYATGSEGDLASTALQSGDNISELINDSGYLTIEADPVFQASEAANFISGDKTKLDNQSGINTGDETVSTIQAKRPLKTVDGQSIEGSGNVKSSEYLFDNNGNKEAELINPSKIEIWACIGQSNMVGYTGGVSSTVGDYDRIDENILQLSNAVPRNNYDSGALNDVITACLPLQYDSNNTQAGVSPAFTFAKKRKELNPNIEKVILVTIGDGGTGFSNNRWNPGDDLYERTVDQIIQAKYKTGGDFKGFVWIQGEQDAFQATQNNYDENQYITDLTTMVTDMRTDISEPNAIFLVNTMPSSFVGSDAKMLVVQNALLNIRNSIFNAFSCDSTDLTDMFDSIHMSAQSNRIIGARLAIIAQQNLTDIENVNSSLVLAVSAKNGVVKDLKNNNITLNNNLFNIVEDVDRGQVMSFASSTDSDVAISINQKICGTSYTKMAWVKLPVIGTVYHNILSGPDHTMGIRGVAHIGLDFGTNATRFNIAENVWEHVAVTWVEGSFRLYKNGVLQTTLTANALPTPGSTINIGALTNMQSAFNGFIDDVRIYSARLTADDILVAMNESIDEALDRKEYTALKNILQGQSVVPVQSVFVDNGDLFYKDGSGTVTTLKSVVTNTGDVYIDQVGKGVIMKSPDGNCWRITPDNTGVLVSTSITCPI